MKNNLAVTFFFGTLLAFSTQNQAWSASLCPWPAWETFKQVMISPEGRVIDQSTPQKITTSEGQSYALFFALVANDHSTFSRLLNWTHKNLAKGSLHQRLPAWLWGKNEQGGWGILDENNASDSDLWIAYSLLEAGRLWQRPEYVELGTQMLTHSAEQTLRRLPKLGLMLLPGNLGFEKPEGWRLNPSYLVPQHLARFSLIDPIWGEVAENTRRMWLEAAPQGLAPDWVLWSPYHGWMPDPQHKDRGSYDAIRTYLWAGMLAPGAPNQQQLVEHLRPMAILTARVGTPPEHLSTRSISQSHMTAGPPGFSAALLPLLQVIGYTRTLETQRQRLTQNPLDATAYYNQVLLLFGQGWDEHRYRFDHHGYLVPYWTSPCKNQ